MKMDKQKITIIVLVVGLFLAAQYILYDRIIDQTEVELNRAYQTGYNEGLTDAVTEIYYQTEDCVYSTITIGNLTKNIFDYSCVKDLDISIP